MADLKYAVLFTGIDKLSGVLSNLGERLMDFGNRAQGVGDKLGEMGERMVRWGENAGLTAALVSEGATKLHEWSEAIQEPAEEMQKNMATMAAMTGLVGDQLESIKQRAVDFASTHPGATAEEWVAGFTRMRGIFQDTSKAMAAENTAAMLKRLGIESNAATRLIQVGWSNLRSAAESTGDHLTRTIQAFGLAPEQANQFATAVGRMGASAAVAHAPFSEVLALAGEANRLLGGGRGATMFASMIQGLETAAAKSKATIDFSHGLVAALQELKSQLSGTPTENLAELAGMGLGAQGPQLLKLLDNLDEVTAKHKQIGDSSGALAKAYGTATAKMADATQRLHQNWANLADAVSTPALGIQARATNALSDAVGGLSRHIEHRSVIAGAATIAVTGIGAAAYDGVQALSALRTMSVFAGQGFKAIKYAAKALDFESWALRGMYFVDAIRAAEIGTKLWTAAQWLLDAALNANPIGAVIAGVALLAAEAYEIYKHWGPISAFFGKLWSKIKSIFGEPVDWLKTTGLNMMKSLGEGILSGIEYPFKAAWDVAKKVGGLFQFHSPPVEGPLREAVLNFRFGEELSKHIKKAPVIAASMGMAARIAAAPVRGASGGGSIVVNYSPTINMNGASGSASDWVKAMRQHADELMRIVREKTFREQRLRFD